MNDPRVLPGVAVAAYPAIPVRRIQIRTSNEVGDRDDHADRDVLIVPEAGFACILTKADDAKQSDCVGISIGPR